MIIAAADVFVSALGEHATELEADYRLSHATLSLQAALTTKEQQYALAAKAGFPCPRTEYIRNRAGLEAFCRDARFPCLIKPLSQREWEVLPEGNPLRGKKIITGETAAELIERYGHAEPFQPQAVVQEIIAGGDDAKYVICPFTEALANGWATAWSGSFDASAGVRIGQHGAACGRRRNRRHVRSVFTLDGLRGHLRNRAETRRTRWKSAPD